MKDFILDTNILIYLMQNNQKLLGFLSDLCQDEFAISAISRFEFLVGVEAGQEKWISTYLDDLECIAVNQEISDKAAEISRNNKNLKFKDALILATALLHKKMLVTADKKLAQIAGHSHSIVPGGLFVTS